jgi:hypothetical protein
MNMRVFIPLSLAAAAAVALVAAPASATGVITCKAGPVSGWKTQDELTKKLTTPSRLKNSMSAAVVKCCSASRVIERLRR